MKCAVWILFCILFCISINWNIINNLPWFTRNYSSADAVVSKLNMMVCLKVWQIALRNVWKVFNVKQPQCLLNQNSIKQDNYHVHTYKHTYIRTYINTYIQAYVQTYIHTYIHTHIHTYKCRYVHTYTYIQTFIHTYIHIHTHIHTNICMYVCTYVHTHIQYICIHTYIHTYKHTYINTWIHVHTDTYIFSIKSKVDCFFVACLDMKQTRSFCCLAGQWPAGLMKMAYCCMIFLKRM